MLVQDFEVQLVGPPVMVGRAAPGFVYERAFCFCCHVFLLGKGN
jgi:hypothetical protein